MAELDPRIAEICQLLGAESFKVAPSGKMVAVILSTDRLLQLYESIKEALGGDQSYVA